MMWFIKNKNFVITFGNPLKNEGNQFTAINVHTLYFSLDFHCYLIYIVIIFLFLWKQIIRKVQLYNSSQRILFYFICFKITRVDSFGIQGIIIENFNGENAIIKMNTFIKLMLNK